MSGGSRKGQDNSVRRSLIVNGTYSVILESIVHVIRQDEMLIDVF
jgi:hypothetical protein